MSEEIQMSDRELADYWSQEYMDLLKIYDRVVNKLDTLKTIGFMQAQIDRLKAKIKRMQEENIINLSDIADEVEDPELN